MATIQAAHTAAAEAAALGHAAVLSDEGFAPLLNRDATGFIAFVDEPNSDYSEPQIVLAPLTPKTTRRCAISAFFGRAMCDG
jgi:hypothetical protein